MSRARRLVVTIADLRTVTSAQTSLYSAVCQGAREKTCVGLRYKDIHGATEATFSWLVLGSRVGPDRQGKVNKWGR
jgi:hypothetical protein